ELRVAFRHEAAHDGDPAFDVETGVVVTTQAGVADAVAGEDRLTPDVAACGEARDRNRASRGRAVDQTDRNMHDTHRDRGIERLSVASGVTRRLKADLAKSILDEGTRCVQARGAEAAPLPRGIGEPGHVAQDTVGRILRARRGCVRPARDVYVGLANAGRKGAVRGKRQPLPVWREEREAVEPGSGGDALEPGAVDADRPEVELPPGPVAVVRGEDDALAVGKERGRERGGAEIRHLHRVGAVRVGNPDLELAGLDQSLAQQSFVLVHLRPWLRTRSAPDDLAAVGVEERAPVLAGHV